MSSVTIKDIARMAGVSHTTVSRALNDSPLINPETKEKIKSIAVSLNYTPNYNARSLVLDRSYQIGLFFTTLHSGTSAGFLFEAMKGVNSVVRDRYNVIVHGIDDYSTFTHINRKSFDGIMLMSQSAADEPFIDYVASLDIPFIVMNREIELDDVLNLVPDDQHGAYKMTDYLLRSGHRRVAIVEGKAGFKSTQARKDGYMKALEAFGVPIREELCVQGEYNLESGYSAMKRLLALEERPTAVFCCSDDMALGAIKAAAEGGLRVPDDISVAGFDDMMYAAYVTPALTTVRRTIEQMSRFGAEKLMALMEKKLAGDSRKTMFHTEIVIRDSVKNILGGE
ncbi:LacI family DNA-binding transcriptional regulator [Paenibacillus sp. YYML68]|uniref:LacI family DNA-binding transcriptional regulator n=1 Tax=Paenibacillus sp. YYML68 TaxID=2909250 RepID=UPI002492CAE0|nr:LacI family DNA-binding transcriptional regulator [Paenibacillus sp. YYML68]